MPKNYLNSVFRDHFESVILERVVLLRHELLGRIDQHLESVLLLFGQDLGVGEGLFRLDDSSEDVLNKRLGVNGLLVQGLFLAAFAFRSCGCQASNGRNPDGRIVQ